MTGPFPADAEIEVLIRAKYPILYIVSWEEELDELRMWAKRRARMASRPPLGTVAR